MVVDITTQIAFGGLKIAMMGIRFSIALWGFDKMFEGLRSKLPSFKKIEPKLKIAFGMLFIVFGFYVVYSSLILGT